MTRRRSWECMIAATFLCGAGHTVRAQDSVSNMPGSSDALTPYGAQRTRYVVNLIPLTGSWGSSYVLGPVLKTSKRPGDTLEQRSGASAISANQLTNQSFPQLDFATWSSPGFGVHPTLNTIPGTVSISAFDRQFGAAISDFSTSATNLITCRIGHSSSAWQQLYVDRLVALCSRSSGAALDGSTVSMGGVDATGSVAFRADPFGATATLKVTDDSIGIVDFAARSNSVNHLESTLGVNSASNGSSTTFSINASPLTIASPTMAPGSLMGGTPQAISLSLLNDVRVGSTVQSGHLDPGLTAHRGNPSFNQVTALGGVGAVATLARTTTTGGRTQAINVFSIDSAGAVVATRSALLTAPIVIPAGTFNAAGDAEFRQYLGQTIFRGPSGQAGIGFCQPCSALVVAATATDPTQGEFIAVATLTASPTWNVAAHAAMPVLDGPSGKPIGTLISASPASMSAPAVDMLGNVYFVAAWQPVVGSPAKGFFKAVRQGDSSYQLELILTEGSAFIGADSNRSYTVTELVMVDSDGIASGTFHQGQLLGQRALGHATIDPASPKAFGGALVNATIRYNNAGTLETYTAALFIGPLLAQGICAGDANADGVTDLTDLQTVLFNFGVSAGATLAQGDVTGDGTVDLADLQAVLFAFGCGT